MYLFQAHKGVEYRSFSDISQLVTRYIDVGTNNGLCCALMSPVPSVTSQPVSSGTCQPVPPVTCQLAAQEEDEDDSSKTLPHLDFV